MILQPDQTPASPRNNTQSSSCITDILSLIFSYSIKSVIKKYHHQFKDYTTTSNSSSNGEEKKWKNLDFKKKILHDTLSFEEIYQCTKMIQNEISQKNENPTSNSEIPFIDEITNLLLFRDKLSENTSQKLHLIEFLFIYEMTKLDEDLKTLLSYQQSQQQQVVKGGNISQISGQNLVQKVGQTLSVVIDFLKILSFCLEFGSSRYKSEEKNQINPFGMENSSLSICFECFMMVFFAEMNSNYLKYGPEIDEIILRSCQSLIHFLTFTMSLSYDFDCSLFKVDDQSSKMGHPPKKGFGFFSKGFKKQAPKSLVFQICMRHFKIPLLNSENMSSMSSKDYSNDLTKLMEQGTPLSNMDFTSSPPKIENPPPPFNIPQLILHQNSKTPPNPYPTNTTTTTSITPNIEKNYSMMGELNTLQSTLKIMIDQENLTKFIQEGEILKARESCLYLLSQKEWLCDPHSKKLMNKMKYNLSELSTQFLHYLQRLKDLKESTEAQSPTQASGGGQSSPNQPQMVIQRLPSCIHKLRVIH